MLFTCLTPGSRIAVRPFWNPERDATMRFAIDRPPAPPL
jgi:hypothetical protein